MIIFLALVVVLTAGLTAYGSITSDQFMNVVMFILGAIFGGAGTGVYMIRKKG
jgi:hypothetical protein